MHQDEQSVLLRFSFSFFLSFLSVFLSFFSLLVLGKCCAGSLPELAGFPVNL